MSPATSGSGWPIGIERVRSCSKATAQSPLIHKARATATILIEPGVPADAPKRVIRGGSFLCSRKYCLSYRPSARHGADPYTSASHIGFRLVSDMRF